MMKRLAPYASRVAAFILAVGGLAALSACNEQGMAIEVPYTETDQGKITWYRDVLPLARKHCQGCHTEDGIAPFSMTSYGSTLVEEAKKISLAVDARAMPPWLPDPLCGKFVDDRRMTDSEIAIFKAWYADGALAGDPKDAPVGDAPMAAHLDSVDATLTPNTIYTPVGDPMDKDKLDDYHCFVLDPKLDADRYLIGFEVSPGVTREVHHVLLYPASPEDVANKDTVAGWTCFGGPGTGGSSILGGWVPGMPPNRFPDKTGIQMKKGDLIVMQVHYNLLNGPPEPDQTTVMLDYADGAVEKPARIFPLVNGNFAIPPKTNNYTDTASITLPADVRVWGVIPHMHTLGKRISLRTESQCLVDIPNWDFHWQQSYYFNVPGGIQLNQGDIATLSCTWSNPRTETVRWGEATTDEMCLSFVYLTQ